MGGVTGTANKLKNNKTGYGNIGTNETGLSLISGGYVTTTGGFNSSNSYIFSVNPTGTTPNVGWLAVSSSNNIDVANNDSLIQGMSIRLLREEPSTPMFKYTELGGLAVKVINGTGSASVKGSVVSVSTVTDNVFILQSNEYDAFGVVYESGIANGEYCWVVVSGIADVLVKNSTAVTRGQVAISADTDGRMIGMDVPNGNPGIDAHFKEIGHCFQSVTSGTDNLCRIVLHFN